MDETVTGSEDVRMRWKVEEEDGELRKGTG